MIQAVVLAPIDMEHFGDAASAPFGPDHEFIKSLMENMVEDPFRRSQNADDKGFRAEIPSRIVKIHHKMQSRRNVGHTMTFAHFLRCERVGRPYDFRTIPYRIFFA